MITSPGTLWRLYTAQRANLPRIVRRHFDGATIAPATGLFRGMTEAAAVIEIVGSADSEAQIRALAADIRRTNNEKQVLIVSVPGIGILEDDGAPDDPIAEFEALEATDDATVN